jgi:hypothetical protein
MIKIIKTEYATEFSPIVRTTHIEDMDFFSLTDSTLTKADFAKMFKDHVGEFGNVTEMHDDGKYISMSYITANRGILEIYLEPPPVPEKKRITKNLESLIAFANSNGYHFHLDQNSGQFGFKWYGFMYDENCEIVTHTLKDYDTAYQATKAMMKKAGLKLYADSKG